MKVRIQILALLLLLSFQAYANELVVAISQTISHPALENTLQGIKDTLEQEYDSKISLIVKNAQGNALLANQIAKHFASLNPNIVIGIGTLTSQALVKNINDIPIVFSSVTDPYTSQIVSNKNQNVFGVSNYVDPAIHFQAMTQLPIPIKKIGVIYNPGEINSVRLVEQMQKKSTQFNIMMNIVPAFNTKEVASAASALCNQKVDTIFINNDNTALAAFAAIVKIGNKCNTKIISSDLDNIAQGAFAAIGPDQYDIGVETAKITIDILNKRITEQKVYYPQKVQIKMNEKR